MRRRGRGYPCLVLSLVVCLLAACGGNPGPPPLRTGSWPYPNGDLQNTRVATDSTISSLNIDKLKVAWSFALSGTAATGVNGAGSFAAAPVVVDGVVYIQDLYANVYAIDLVTGKLKWEYTLNTAEVTGPGPDGVAVANGVVYGTSPRTAFALDAATGKPVWLDNSLLGNGQGTFEIQPQVADGRVYLGSGYGSGPGGGVLIALDAATGRELWTFDTVVGGTTASVQATGLGSGGAWETPLVRDDGSVTFGTGNPYQTPASAMSNPSAQLYTDSDVNLDAATGKLRWYYQGVPDDFKDYDMQASPVAATINGKAAVLGSGKMGYVYAMDAATGKLIWKTPVGEHDGHDGDSLKILRDHATIQAPYTYEPGAIGGVLSNMALAGDFLYVAVVDLPFTFGDTSQVLGTPAAGAGNGTGSVEALDLISGKVLWDVKAEALPLGAMTVSNDLVVTTLIDGSLVAYDRINGTEVYRTSLPTTTNSPIAIAGNTVLVPAGGVMFPGVPSGNPQLVAYTVP